MTSVLWLSSGVSSAVCWMLCKKEIDYCVYIDVSDQHEDSQRFNRDLCDYVGGGLRSLSQNTRGWMTCVGGIATWQAPLGRSVRRS